MHPRAFILAGGLGTRLRPIVSDRPKPLAAIGEKPFLEYQLEMLRAHGIERFVFCTGYRHEQISDHFQDGERWQVRIDYSIEHEPLGTAGALKLAERFVDGPLLVLNGDTYFETDVSRLIAFHGRAVSQSDRVLGTLALTEVRDPRSYGSVRLDADRRITGFEEKRPDGGEGTRISAGMYVFEPEVISRIPPGAKVSLECDTFPELLAAGDHLMGYPMNGFFVDMGTPEGYYTLQTHLEELHSC